MFDQLKKIGAIVAILIAIMGLPFAAGVAYERQETNSLKRDYAQMMESQELWKTLSSRYQRDFQTTQVAFRLMPGENTASSPLAQAIARSCVDNCGYLRVFDTATSMMVVAVNTAKDQCSSIKMPERVFVQEPPVPNNMAAGAEDAAVCIPAVIFATHGPIN